MGNALSPFNLNGKVAVVTGAAGGIGEASARIFAAAGASVMLTDIKGEACEQVASELKKTGVDARWMTMDVSSEPDWQKLIAELKSWHGRWDVLLNNAGIFIGGALESNNSSELQKIHSINVDSVFMGTRFAGSTMKPGACFGNGGSVINLSSIAGLIGVPGHSIYGASKGAVASFTRHAAVEFARFGYGVRVNSLHPGLIDTDMGAMVLDDFVELGLAPSTDAALSLLREQMIPCGRLGTVSDIANAALYLASDASDYVTGIELTVDGGFTAA